MRYKVVILNANYPEYSIEKTIFNEIDVEIVVVDGVDTVEERIAITRDADAIMTRETVIPREHIEALERCKVILRYGVGVDNIDLQSARERKIYVANVPDYGTDSVAEHAAALVFSTMRRIPKRDRDVRRGVWDVGDSETMYSFAGKTLGVIGLGRIGRSLIRKLSGLDWGEVIGYDPYIQDVPGVRLTDLDEVFAKSDVISLHMPLTDETYHMVNADRLHQMKNNAVLVNTARGGLIDIDALTAALKNKEILGAGIDVFETEPPDIESEIFKLDNAVLTDHAAWYSVEALQNLHRTGAMQVAEVLKGNRPKFWVNKWE